MARPVSEHPTDLELQILKILWKDSPTPVRDIRRSLAEQGRDIAHTSVITTLNTMVEKKYLKRSKSGNAFLFSPNVSHDQVSKKLIGDVVNRVFDGSPKDLMLSLFDCSKIDEDELKELRKIINQKMKSQ